MRITKGGCQCGDLRITATGEPLRVGICHCLDCRKHHGAVFYAAAIFPAKAVTLSGDFSEFRGRVFCPKCGGSVCAHSGPETEVHLGTLDQPDSFSPTYEKWCRHRESWLPPFHGVTSSM